jgi:hypothetical protein
MTGKSNAYFRPGSAATTEGIIYVEEADDDPGIRRALLPTKIAL